MRELIADINKVILTQDWTEGGYLIHSAVPSSKREWLIKQLERLHRKKHYITYQKSILDEEKGKGYIFAFIEEEITHQVVDEFYLFLKSEEGKWKVYWIDNHENVAKCYMEDLIDPLYTPREMLQEINEIPPDIQPFKALFEEKDPLQLIHGLETYVSDPLFLEQLKWKSNAWKKTEFLNLYQLSLPKLGEFLIAHVLLNEQMLWFVFKNENESYVYKGYCFHLDWANLLAHLL
jgi:hypothetical protein